MQAKLPQTPNEEQEKRFGAQVKFYGGVAAVCFQSSLLQERIHTLNIETAAILDQGPQWQDKLNFQLSENELALFCGLLHGYLPALHIRRGTKGVEMVRQRRDAKNHPGLYIHASSGTAAQHRLLLPTGIMARVGALAAWQFTRDLGIDASIALPAIRAACALHH